MGLPVSQDNRNLITLNEDVKLVSNVYGEWDLKFDNKDYVNVTGLESLNNACIIAILTRYQELERIPLYERFGCRIHELVKENQTKMVVYKMELFIWETLENMRRVKTVNSVKVSKSTTHTFEVTFNVTSITDEIVEGQVSL